MDTDENDSLADIDVITEKVIGSAYQVLTELVIGFNEKVYENALAYELRKQGIWVDQQEKLKVWYDDVVVGVYFADLLVQKLVPVEIKVAKGIDDAHLAQALNQLKATQLRVALVLNFGTSRLGIKRVICG